MKDKLAIIVSGGGMKCAWEVGVLLCLVENYHITSPDILIAASGSSGTGSYYVAQQYASMRNIWGNLLSVKEMVNPWRFWKLVDVNYLVDTVFKQQDPLDVAKLYAADTHYLIPALHAQKAEVHYFSNKGPVDIFQAMKATMAIPIAFKINPHVIIDGEPYCDSMLTTNAYTHIAKAVEMGAKKILIIDVLKKKQTGIQYYLFHLWVAFHSWLFKKNYLKLTRQMHRYKAPEGVEVFIIKRKRKSVVTALLDNNIDHLRKAIEQGYQEALGNKDLANFLSK